MYFGVAFSGPKWESTFKKNISSSTFGEYVGVLHFFQTSLLIYVFKCFSFEDPVMFIFPSKLLAGLTLQDFYLSVFACDSSISPTSLPIIS